MGAPRTGRARARAGVQLVLRAAAARIAARGAGVRQQIGRRESARGRVPQPWRAAAAPHARAVRERSGRRACGTHSRTKHHVSEAKRSRGHNATPMIAQLCNFGLRRPDRLREHVAKNRPSFLGQKTRLRCLQRRRPCAQRTPYGAPSCDSNECMTLLCHPLDDSEAIAPCQRLLS